MSTITDTAVIAVKSISILFHLSQIIITTATIRAFATQLTTSEQPQRKASSSSSSRQQQQSFTKQNFLLQIVTISYFILYIFIWIPYSLFGESNVILSKSLWNTVSYCVPWNGMAITYFLMNRMLLYLFYFARVEVVFRGSLMAVEKGTVVKFIGLIFVLAVLSVSTGSLAAVNASYVGASVPNGDFLYCSISSTTSISFSAVFGAVLLLEIGVMTFAVYLFMSKLNRLRFSTEDRRGSAVSQERKTLTDLTLRSLTLFYVTLISSFVSFSSGGVSDVPFYFSCLLTFDTALNSFCIYCNFRFGLWAYERVLIGMQKYLVEPCFMRCCAKSRCCGYDDEMMTKIYMVNNTPELEANVPVSG